MEFKTITTLCYIINADSEVLLIMKKRGFGAGKWNGPGGKVKENETLQESVIREIKEEVNLDIKNPKNLGCIEFVWPDNPENNNKCHIFSCREFEGEADESEECAPAWFKIDEIPYGQMWEDDKYWYPRVLAGEKVEMCFYFDQNNQVIKYEEK